MKGQYRNKEQQLLNVVEFDEANKMAYAELPTGQHKWFMESQYSTWVKEGEDSAELIIEKIEATSEREVIPPEEPILPPPVTYEEDPNLTEKRKRTYKKKEK